MTTATTVNKDGPSPAAGTDPSLRTTHLLLTIQSTVVVLVSANRLGPSGKTYVLPNEFLRWLDLNNMLLALASLLVFYLLQRHLATGPAAAANRRGSTALGLAFIVGAYLLAAGYGDHETTNYLNARFCPDSGPARFGRRVAHVVEHHQGGCQAGAVLKHREPRPRALAVARGNGACQIASIGRLASRCLSRAARDAQPPAQGLKNVVPARQRCGPRCGPAPG
jgi:hypothetical protein